MTLRARLLASICIAVCAGIIASAYQFSYQRQAGDFTWPLVAARDLLDGLNPYDRPLPAGAVAYPLPAALVALPLVALPLVIAAGVFMGLSSGLLAWGLLGTGERWRLLVFMAFPFWQAIQVVNWSPLLLAVLYLPSLLPLALVKPHVGLPLVVMRFSWRRLGAVAAFGLASLAVLWSWPIDWLNHLAGYAGAPALLILPFGPLLALAALRWRDEHARYLLLYSLVPLRPFYDYLMLWYLPQNRRDMAILVACSWLGFFGWSFVPWLGASWMVITLYLPLLAMVWHKQTRQR